MELYLDSADLKEIEEAFKLGFRRPYYYAYLHAPGWCHRC